ncbi:MAG: DNA repair protein RecO [Chitinophagales bacterium]|nr:DNA repair protein RecO [Chitinophagales bacterium]MDW8419237.1 DNA repair protein RecO [Chitinophagales bacterium]
MYFHSRAIVLQTIKYSETSIITKLYTDQHGLVSFIVKGVRSVRGKGKAVLFQPLNILHVTYAHRSNKNLQYLREYRQEYVYQSIPHQPLKTAVALFMLETLHRALRSEEADTALFDFVLQSFIRLDQQSLRPDFHLYFLVFLSRYLGFAPRNNYSTDEPCFHLQDGIFVSAAHRSPLVLPESESRYIYELLLADDYSAPPVHRHLDERRKTLRNLIRFYELHIENFHLYSPDVLETVLS